MASTLSNVVVTPLPGGQVMVHCNAAGSADYDTATGEVIDLSAYIAGTSASTVFTCLATGNGGYVPQHNLGTAAAGALKWYEAGADAAALDECANSTDLSGTVASIIAIGPGL